MALTVGYFDESGDLDADERIFCVSGYFMSADQSEEMEKNWRKVLDEFQIPFFHMVDCAHGNEFFEEIDDGDRIELVKQLITLIKQHTEIGFSFLVKGDAFNTSRENPDAYSMCVDRCVSALYTFCNLNNIGGDIAYFFECGHSNQHDAYKHVAKRSKVRAQL